MPYTFNLLRQHDLFLRFTTREVTYVQKARNRSQALNHLTTNTLQNLCLSMFVRSRFHSCLPLAKLSQEPRESGAPTRALSAFHRTRPHCSETSWTACDTWKGLTPPKNKRLRHQKSQPGHDVQARSVRPEKMAQTERPR